MSEQDRARNPPPGSPPPLRDIPIHPLALELFLGPFPSEQVRYQIIQDPYHRLCKLSI